MQVIKKVTEVVSIRLSEAELYQALADHIGAKTGTKIDRKDVIIRRGDDGEFEVSVDITREVNPPKAPKKAKPRHDHAVVFGATAKHADGEF